MLWFGRGFRRRCRTITHNCLASFADAISTRLLDAPSFPPVKAYRRIPHAPRLLDAAHVVVLFLSVDVAWVLINRFSSSQAAGMPTSPAAVRSSRFCFPSVGVHSRWSTLRHARQTSGRCGEAKRRFVGGETREMFSGYRKKKCKASRRRISFFFCAWREFS